MSCLNVSIQAPGLGNQATSFGNAPMRRYGLAIPNPMHAKIVYDTSAGCANAPENPSLVANSPAAPLPTKPGMGISQTPRKLKAITNTTAASVMLNPSYANCCPQPNCSLNNNRKATGNVANNMNTASIPS